jgi:hypothetical protein
VAVRNKSSFSVWLTFGRLAADRLNALWHSFPD